MIPYRILAPIILALCFWGAYCIRNTLFDIWVAAGFGVLGYIMKRHKLPAAPFILAFILGDPLELHFRQVAAMGPLYVLFQRPISLVLLGFAAILAVAFTFSREKRVVVAVDED